MFVACEPGTSWRELFQHQRVLLFHFPYLDYSERLQAWQSCLDDRGIIAPRNTLEAVADRFILTPGQIQDAVTSIINHAILDSDGSAQTMNEDVLFEAARNQSSQQLGSLAVKVDTKYTWEDLVLPETTRRQVREVAAAIRNRHLVYSQWGFNQRMDWGQGLKMLFSGTSGTGKTMTAGIIANDLGLDMYKIDLSGIVSKYIGETEKNLNKIFRAAHSSNAILFFDEADALFGKRSEVKDAHDRYANIEVAYLLQKIEEHEGAVILATNLSRNIDQAFSRQQEPHDEKAARWQDNQQKALVMRYQFQLQERSPGPQQ